MNSRMLRRLLYALILFGMGVNGALYLSWFLSSPNPDRIGYWYLIYFVVFPFLGSLGIVALALKRSLNLSWWLGILLVLYVGVLTLLLNSTQFGFEWVLSGWPEGRFEQVHVVAFGITLVGLLVAIQRANSLDHG